MQRELTLNDGNKIPLIGFGTYKATEKEGVESVKNALLAGYRLLDTAAVYGNEAAVGKGIAESGVLRKEIVVTTKLWRDSIGYDQAKKAFEQSLAKLGLDYIDLYLIHWPANDRNYKNWQQANADAWRALEELKADGLVRSIGVSNFWEEHLAALFHSAHVCPAVNQIEFHPGYWQPGVTAFCKTHGIAVQSWSPLARGSVFSNQTLLSIAQKHCKTVAQVCLRWIIQHHVSAIPKSVTVERIQENIDLFAFELTPDEMTQIDHLPQLGFSGELPNIWPQRIT